MIRPRHSAPAFEALVAIGEEIVEQEVRGDRDDRPPAICAAAKPKAAKCRREPQHRELDDEADAADEGEQGEPHRHDVADQLVGDQHAEFPRHHGIELALAVLARAELVMQLLERGSAPGEEASRSSRILKPWPERRRIAPSNASRRIMKKPLIGSAMSALQTRRESRVARPLILRAPLVPVEGAAAADIAAADDEIVGLGLQRLQHVAATAARRAAGRRRSPRRTAPSSPARLRCTRSTGRAGRCAAGRGRAGRRGPSRAPDRRCRRGNRRRRK